MHAFPIHNDQDLARAIALVQELWDAEPGTAQGDLIDVMATLIDLYETSRRDLPAADPIELIRFKLAELQWSQNFLAKQLGWSSGRVSEVLNNKRPLTLAMVQKLSRVLQLAPGLLVPQTTEPTDGLWIQIPAHLAPVVVARAQQSNNSPAALVEAWIASSLDSTGCPTPTAAARGPRPTNTLSLSLAAA